MLIPTNAKVIAARFAIKIIIERALLSVFEKDTDQTRPADQDGGHLFDNDPPTPFSIICMNDFISQAKIESIPSFHF